MEKIIVCCDFDGTIMMHDLLDIIIDHHLGIGTSCANDDKVLNGEKMGTLLKQSFDKINTSFISAVELLNANTAVDPYFREYYDYCMLHKIDFFIVSSGLKTLIKHYLPFVPESNIFANDVEIIDNKWTINLCDESGLDKANVISSMKNNKILYIGDGVSDICVAEMVNILYVKKNKSLHYHCLKYSIPHREFNTFDDILADMNIVQHI